MINKDLNKDVQALIKKHGLQNSDVKVAKSANGSEETQKATNKSDSQVVANLTDSIAEKVAGIIQDKKKIKHPKDVSKLNDTIKTKIFAGYGNAPKELSYPNDLSSLSGDEKIVNFFKALMYHKVDPASNQVLRALVEGTDAQGGYLVPEELRSEVFRIMPDFAVMRKIGRVFPMSSDTLLLNNLGAKPAAYWTSEYASKSTTSAEFGQVTLSPNDLVCLLPVTDQLIADANINIVQFITELFAEVIGTAEDKAFFTGSGTGQPKGIDQESITSKSAGASLDFDDIIDLIDLVAPSVSQSAGAAFVGNRFVKRLLRKVKDDDGGYIWRQGGGRIDGQVGKLPDTAYGYDFHEQNDLSQDELYFGDWRFYAIGDRQSLAVTTTTEGGDAWRRNAMEIKAVERVDGRAIITAPFAKLTNV